MLRGARSSRPCSPRCHGRPEVTRLPKGCSLVIGRALRCNGKVRSTKPQGAPPECRENSRPWAPRLSARSPSLRRPQQTGAAQQLTDLRATSSVVVGSVRFFTRSIQLARAAFSDAAGWTVAADRADATGRRRACRLPVQSRALVEERPRTVPRRAGASTMNPGSRIRCERGCTRKGRALGDVPPALKGACDPRPLV